MSSMTPFQTRLIPREVNEITNEYITNVTNEYTTNNYSSTGITQVTNITNETDHEKLQNLLGGITDNHHHVVNFATVSEAESATGVNAITIARVEDQDTFYKYVSSSLEVRDGAGVLNTAFGGASRWLGFAGRWNTNQYDDLFIDTLQVPTGATAPDQVTIPGLAGLYAFAFDGNNTIESLAGTMEILHGWKVGSDLWPHIHWSPFTSAVGNVRWVFEYSVATGPTFEFSELTTLVAVQAASGLGVNGRPKQHNVEFSSPIPGANLAMGSQIRFVIRREPQNALDTYPNDALLWAVGIHYLKDSAGSLQRFVK